MDDSCASGSNPALDPSPGYGVKTQQVDIGDHGYRIRSLLDRQQFFDPHGHASRRGISSANWSHFGQLWPAGIALAEHVDSIELDGQRILELGCGLAVPGLVLHRRRADVTVSDRHPDCPSFLDQNLRLNGLGPLPFLDLDWSRRSSDLGSFDLFIASDVLYERTHSQQLTRFFGDHANVRADVIMVDPGRGQSNEFGRRMLQEGFSSSTPLVRPTHGHRIIRYSRGL